MESGVRLSVSKPARLQPFAPVGKSDPRPALNLHEPFPSGMSAATHLSATCHMFLAVFEAVVVQLFVCCVQFQGFS